MAATYADPIPCTTSTVEKSDARAYVGAMNAPVQPVSDRAPRARKPDWIRVKAPTSPGYAETRKLMRELNLPTVCEEAACPHIGACMTNKHSTETNLSENSTRSTPFCNVQAGECEDLRYGKN